MIGGNPQPSTIPGGEIWGVEFNGMIDEVRFSKVVRYTKDFKPQRRFKTDADTLALYHFDAGKGKLAVDSSENGHHAQIWDAQCGRAATQRGASAPG